jgi:DNA-damage-inducible protein D
MPTNNHIVVFSDIKIRRVFHESAWWFSVIDVIQALTDSPNPRDYWYKIKARVKNEEES